MNNKKKNLRFKLKAHIWANFFKTNRYGLFGWPFSLKLNKLKKYI